MYRDYNCDRSLLAVEAQARAARRGLWGLPEAERVPPWGWRRAGRGGTAQRERTDAAVPVALPAVLVEPAPAPGLACGAKRACGQMAGYGEARSYLNQCGLSRLDADSDGVRCERLCR